MCAIAGEPSVIGAEYSLDNRTAWSDKIFVTTVQTYELTDYFLLRSLQRHLAADLETATSPIVARPDDGHYSAPNLNRPTGALRPSNSHTSHHDWWDSHQIRYILVATKSLSDCLISIHDPLSWSTTASQRHTSPL